MKVTRIADTMLTELPESVSGTAMKNRMIPDIESGTVTDADTLAEFAGRSCYRAYGLRNPATEQNPGYLANILRQGHESVLEHSTAVFFVEGASRSMLTQLERHRHISFSVESQRYVDPHRAHAGGPAVPPALRGDPAEDALRDVYAHALGAYEALVTRLRGQGYGVKRAREAARAFLPNATPVDFVVSGNLRAWRDVIGKRWHESADEDIKEFAGEVLGLLREIAPNSFQDIPEEPWSDG